jgi:glucose-6-phosphate 1-dehydrogenase
LRDKLRPYLAKAEQNEKIIEDFLSRCHYQSGTSYGDVNSWQELDIKIASFEEDIAAGKNISRVNRLFYFAIPPNVFAETGEAIKTSCMSKLGFSRMIVEKPFGKDLESCKEILARVRRYALFRIVANDLLTQQHFFAYLSAWAAF